MGVISSNGIFHLPWLPHDPLVGGFDEGFALLARGHTEGVVLTDAVVRPACERRSFREEPRAAHRMDLCDLGLDLLLPDLKLLGSAGGEDACKRAVIYFGRDAESISHCVGDFVACDRGCPEHVPSELSTELEARVEQEAEASGGLVVYGHPDIAPVDDQVYAANIFETDNVMVTVGAALQLEGTLDADDLEGLTLPLVQVLDE